jgi:hypothetical protein
MMRLPRGAASLALVGAMTAASTSCGSERDMPDSVEMPDTMEVKRALEDPAAGDAMLDTMPGGEMVRGDSAAARRLLRDKMP